LIMAYDPNSITESDRSLQYSMMWVGAGGAIFSTANLFAGMDNMLSAIAFGAMAGGPLSVAFGSRADEYLGSLINVGLRWMCAALGVYLMVLFLIATGDVANELGFWLASGDSRADEPAIRALAVNGLTATIALSLAFYAGYAFAWIRDKVGESA